MLWDEVLGAAPDGSGEGDWTRLLDNMSHSGNALVTIPPKICGALGDDSTYTAAAHALKIAVSVLRPGRGWAHFLPPGVADAPDVAKRINVGEFTAFGARQHASLSPVAKLTEDAEPGSAANWATDDSGEGIAQAAANLTVEKLWHEVCSGWLASVPVSRSGAGAAASSMVVPDGWRSGGWSQTIFRKITADLDNSTATNVMKNGISVVHRLSAKRDKSGLVVGTVQFGKTTSMQV